MQRAQARDSHVYAGIFLREHPLSLRVFTRSICA